MFFKVDLYSMKEFTSDLAKAKKHLVELAINLLKMICHMYTTSTMPLYIYMTSTMSLYIQDVNNAAIHT